MTTPARRLRAAVATTATAVALLATGALVATPAQAVACTDSVRYAASNNTLYLLSGTVDLPQLKEICSAAKVVQDEKVPGVWYLNSNLVVQNGATLRIRGAAAGGSVNVLRLMSKPSGQRVDVVEITAQHGTLDLASTALTSWDDAANGGLGGPDVDPSVPSTAGLGGKGRAFIRAVSFMDGDVPRTSRMDITDSDLGYLGFNAGEAYGVAYKARGCGAGEGPEKICGVLDVFGSQTGSRFHDNYMGTYTWGALGMTFDGNEYDHNVMYGLDPHDDSDALTIIGNHAHHNGAHGIICSQRCDGLLIAGNHVHHNGIPPYPGSAGQIHGIMIHRGVTNTVIKNNNVHDHPTGAGIAVFDSFDDVVHDNVLAANKVGLRVSVGSHDMSFARNTVTGSASYAVHAFPGSDAAEYGIKNGRSANLSFTDNTFDGAGSSVVRLLSTDGFRFTGNVVKGSVGAVRSEDSTGLVWEGTPLPLAGIVLRLGGNATVQPLGVFKTSLGAGSIADVVSADGRLSQMSSSGAPAVRVTPSESRITLTGGPSVVTSTVTPRDVQLVPASGQVSAKVMSWSATSRRLAVFGGTKGVTTQYRTGGLTPGAKYTVRVDGAVLATPVASVGGTIAWSYSEPTGGSHEVTIKAG